MFLGVNRLSWVVTPYQKFIFKLPYVLLSDLNIFFQNDLRYYYLHNFARLLPNEVQWLIMDFIDTGVDVHYDENMEEDLEDESIEQDL